MQGALDDHGVSRYDYDKARLKDPLKSQAHARARQDGADAMADAIPYIADTEKDPQRAKNMIDARKWLTGAIKPREYGQRVDVNLTETVDISAALLEAKRRALRLTCDPAQRLIPQDIDGHAVLVPEPAGNKSVAPESAPDDKPSIFD